jgi:uncharacterized protein (DUF1697 family)
MAQPTQTVVALLRGINVGGKVLKMDAVRASFEALGFRDVRTYVQSGNVLFAGKSSADAVAKKIAAKLQEDSGLKVSVIVKTGAEVGRIIRMNPFLRERGIDESKLHVSFLADVPTKAALSALSAIKSGSDLCRHSGTEVYVYCPDGYGRTKLSNNVLEKALGVVATTRNWNTVNKLYEMASE